MVALPEDTLLAINGLVVPKSSARFVRQTLTQISQAGNFRRTVNMQLRNIAPAAAASKYRTVITCTDIYAPIWDQLRVGMVVTIDCIVPLFYAIGGTPEKTAVANSTFEFDGLMWYRPSISMMITSWGDDMDENQAQRSWSLEAEE
jgi:hypothetical protein